VTLQRLDGKLAAITGAAAGIGCATAIRLANEGARLALLDRDADALKKISNMLGERGTSVMALEVDCTDEKSVAESFVKISSDMGFVEILVNNVGQSARERTSEFHASSSDVWQFVINVSLMSTLIASRQVAGWMREARRGKIVNVSSTAGLSGETGVSDYAAAKMGVIGFTRSLAQELAPFGVNVNSVCPGVTNTGVLRQLPPEFVSRIKAKIPLGRVAEPEDIAAAIAFLCSNDARHITGQSLVIDGGHWMI
jgi:NAD(P)-dependent dehydrogenase (short-subunit alcohol dehydrogenase family)